MKKILFILIFALCGLAVFAQDDSDENRFVFDYTLTPKEVTIADIKITGASSYEDYVLIGFSGLNKQTGTASSASESRRVFTVFAVNRGTSTGVKRILSHLSFR